MNFRSLLLAAGLVCSAMTAYSMEMGEVSIAGNICQNPVGTHKVVSGADPDSFVIPLGVYLKKDNTAGLARGACTFAVPLKAEANKRIVVRAARQFYSLRTYQDVSKAKIDVELFKAGSRGPLLSAEIPGSEGLSKTHGFLVADDVIVSGCGESLNLRGNLSAMIVGTGKARVFAKDLQLHIVEEICP